MFAVKGWNVDATLLKPQTELFKQPDHAQAEGKASRKRKRDRGEQNSSSETVKQEQDDTQKQTKKSKKQKTKLADSQDAQPAVTTDNKSDDNRKDKKSSSKKSRKDKHTNTSDGNVNPDAPDSVTKPVKADASTSVVKHVKPAASTPKLTPMQAAMRQKLVSARFRHLNETLYTAPSQSAQELFNANPEMFEDYHAGFRQQVSVWPENPVDKMIQKIRERGGVRLPTQKKAFKSKPRNDEPVESLSVPPLPRTQGTCFIADCGCGDARIAQTLKSANDLQKLNVKVLSYDLHSPSSLVTKADISALPLADGSVDVAIFCLALMGTNWISFIEEAYRVLHWKGELWIAEIKSRFARVGKQGKVVEHSVGNRRNRVTLQKEQDAKRKEQEESLQDEVLQTEVDGVEKVSQATDVQAFVDVLKRRGFVLKDEHSSIDLSNKMFVSMEFVKAATPSKGKGYVEPPSTGKKFIKRAPAEQEVSTQDETKTLKPCLYKIR